MTDIVTQDYRLQGREPGLSLLLRNKRRRDKTSFDPASTLLFCHGATYPSSVTFDYPVDGVSWMDVLAAEGFDVWALDLLGYGGSDRPDVMAADPMAHPPIVDTDHAVADVSLALDQVLVTRALPRCCLMGYSWGTGICGRLAGMRPNDVERLVLYAPIWKPSGRGIKTQNALGAYRTVTAEAMIERWRIDLDEDQAAQVASPEAMRAWTEAVLASDPTSGTRRPAAIRAPGGVVKDVRERAEAGTTLYDPALIRAPTLIVVGEWDRETPPEQAVMVFNQLTAVAEKRCVLIGRGTHALLIETNRGHLHRTVDAFLKEGWV